MTKLETTFELINPPLTADYDQLSAAQIYENNKQVENLTDLDSVVKYLKKEQEKLISFPADKYLKSCKEAAERLIKNEGRNYEYYDGNTEISFEKDVKLLSEVSEVMAEKNKRYSDLTRRR